MSLDEPEGQYRERATLFEHPEDGLLLKVGGRLRLTRFGGHSVHESGSTSITTESVVQLQGIAARLVQGQEAILGKLSELGGDVAALQLDAAKLQAELTDLRGWLETRFDGVDKAVNAFQQHQH